MISSVHTLRRIAITLVCLYWAADAAPAAAQRFEMSACADHNPQKNLYWGDLHSHTSYSLDAYTYSTRNSPQDAFAFARGTPVPIASGGGGFPGQVVAIDRPLDFLAVTDHSEFFNVTGECVLDTGTLYARSYCRAYRAQGTFFQRLVSYFALGRLALTDPVEVSLCLSPRRTAGCEASARETWQRSQDAAAMAYEPCEFTSLVGFEWTAATGAANLHRNVIFGSDVVPDLPLDYIHYPTPLALWKGLDAECQESSGCDALTIPHNSNLSRGRMWASAGDPKAVPYMERYQRLVEIYQHKGASECTPDGALSDPDCDFEYVPFHGKEPPSVDAAGYVRPALAEGLSRGALTGTNPLKLGIVGSTDTHNGTPGAVKEDVWQGHAGVTDNTPDKRLVSHHMNFSPGGITGVWSQENTRASIFSALKRRETYGTSGPRISVRFYHADVRTPSEAQALCNDPDFPNGLLAVGASPMGSDVAEAQTGGFLFVQAMMDEEPLEEIQIVKLASDAAGQTTSSIRSFQLAGADQRVACVYWSDPDYRPENPTAYYARVLQGPTWRWSHYDCQRDPTAESCSEVDRMLQERAWTSPIFMPMASLPDVIEFNTEAQY